jgi:hypothetical protein
MDAEKFQIFLKRGGRAPNVIRKVIGIVDQYAGFLHDQRGGVHPDQVSPQDLDAFVVWIENTGGRSAKTHLWGIHYYYKFTGNEGMRAVVAALREERIVRAPFALADFRGVDAGYIARLSASGIRNVRQMLEAGRTGADRQRLADQTGIPMDAILELAKLSDLARLPGVKGVRARLYYDAGVDMVKKIAALEPEQLRRIAVEFVERTGFDGIPTLPAEALYTVGMARKLPQIIEN